MYTRIVTISTFCVLAASALGMHESRTFINADDVHNQGIIGNGVTVAVIDTGINYAHPGLAGAVTAGGTSFTYGAQTQDYGIDIWPQFSGHHGTYMSLIVTAPWGVAPGASILPVRVFDRYWDDQNQRWVLNALRDDIVDAINYVRNRRAIDPSIRVINMSFGSYGAYFPCYCDDWDPEYKQAIANARVDGIITFAATGNEAVCGGISMPACFSSAVPVAANYDADWYPGQYFEPPADCADLNPERYRVVCFSNATDNCGYFLAAPGFNITVGGFSGDGTSQATAHCSGVAALMFDKSGPCGSLTADLARTIIYNTATRQDWAYPWCQLPDQPKHLNALTAVNAVTAGSCSPVVGDLNCDSILDGSDLDGFSVCMTGPRSDPIGGGCTCADFPASRRRMATLTCMISCIFNGSLAAARAPLQP